MFQINIGTRLGGQADIAAESRRNCKGVGGVGIYRLPLVDTVDAVRAARIEPSGMQVHRW
jgi:hypothetical protein